MSGYTLIVDTQGAQAIGGHVWWHDLHELEVIEIMASFGIGLLPTDLPEPGEFWAGGPPGLWWEIHGPKIDADTIGV